MHRSDLILLVLLAIVAAVFRKGLVSNGWGFDRAVAAMFMGAKHGETMSYQTAVAEEADKRWGCVLCWLLGMLVEMDHCAKTLELGGPPTSVIASYRAGALLLVLAALFCAVPWAIGRFL